VADGDPPAHCPIGQVFLARGMLGLVDGPLGRALEAVIVDRMTRMHSSAPQSRRRLVLSATLAAGSIAIASCGSSGDSAPSGPSTPVETSSTNAAPATTVSTTAATAATTVVAGSAWKEEVANTCDAFNSGREPIPDPDGTAPSIVRFVEAIQAMTASVPKLEDIEVPPDRRAAFDEILTIFAAGADSLATAGAAAERGDLVAAQAALTQARDGWSRGSGLLALAGARCGEAEPARVETAALNVVVELGPHQLAAGFGSMWVTQKLGTGVVRIDPSTGEVLATIDIGDSPFKLQPADGRMWVRAIEAYVAIDPATNTVVATLPKADVGPAANRSWAVDGAMWICDGQRLHRYDPTTVHPVAVVELGIDCGQVYAADDLVVAWTYNEDEGESGASAAVFIDPATNERLASVNLPVDVGVPVVLDGKVFFAGWGGSTAVVIDRATWGAAATPDLGRPTSGSILATDGERIFVPTHFAAGPQDVLVVDGATFTVTDTIESLGNNSVAVVDGALWTADGHFDVVQRRDL
jgi:hypothetical protein